MSKIGANLVALPRKAFTTASLTEASEVLLDYLASLLPGTVAGWLAVADAGLTTLRPMAALQRQEGQARLTSVAVATLSLEESDLLHHAFQNECPMQWFSSPGATAEGKGTGKNRRGEGEKGRRGKPNYPITQLPNTLHPTPYSLLPCLQAIALPMVSRHGKVGAFLLRCEGGGPDAEAFARLEAAAAAAALLLHDLHRDNLFHLLEQSKQEWQATFDSLHDLLYIHDDQGRLLKVNRALAERFGITSRELLACQDVFKRHLPSCCALMEPMEWVSETWNATFEMTCAPVFDYANKRVGCVHILRDLTERRRMEAQIRQNEKLAALGGIASGLAHELNNPLTSITGYARLLNKSALPDGSREADYIRYIGLEAERAGRIVHHLLSFARQQTTRKTPLSLNEVVLQTADLSAYRMQVERIDLPLTLRDDLPPILGNFHELQQVLINLLTNAAQSIQAHKGQGRIALTTTRTPEGRVRLTVEDNGGGIAPEHRARLFDPFFTTKDVGQGTGLGLSLCYGILRAHDATIQVESEVGSGATFLLDFPLCGETAGGALTLLDTRRDASTAKTPDIEEGEAVSLPPLHLALLDDEPLLCEMLADTLAEQGHCVEVFHSPDAALAALETQTYDVLLSDVKMPGMNGMEFYRRVQESHPAQAARILFLTGDVLAPEIGEFFERTGCLHLNKPFPWMVLESCIATLLQRVEASPGCLPLPKAA